MQITFSISSSTLIKVSSKFSQNLSAVARSLAHVCARHTGDYFALISGLRSAERSSAEGAGPDRPPDVFLGRCRGEIAHKSLTTRTLLQKRGPGARVARVGPFCYCRRAGLIYRANVDNARNILACSLRKSRFFGSPYTVPP